jgi:hypothetical protein
MMYKKSATSALLNFMQQFNIVILLLNRFRNALLANIDLQWLLQTELEILNYLLFLQEHLNN